MTQENQSRPDVAAPSPVKNPGRFDNDPERARIAGRKGGENPNNAGRFDNNPARAREAGQKGGQSSQAARHALATKAANAKSTNGSTGTVL